MTDEEIERLSVSYFVASGSQITVEQLAVFAHEVQNKVLEDAAKEFDAVSIANRALNVTSNNLAMLALSNTADRIRALKKEPRDRRSGDQEITPEGEI